MIAGASGPSLPEYGFLHCEPASGAGDRKVGEAIRQALRFLLADHLQRPGQRVGADHRLGTAMLRRQLRQRRDDNLSEKVFPAEALHEPPVQELLDFGASALRSFVRLYVVVEEGDPLVERDRNGADEVRSVVGAMARLEENPNGVGRRKQASILRGQESCLGEWIVVGLLRLGPQLRGEHG